MTETEEASGPGLPVVMAMPPEIDLVNCQHLAGQLAAAVTTSATVMIADLTGTGYCDLSGIRMLATAYLDAMERGVQLRLVIPDGAVLRILALMDLDRWLQISPTLDDAIAQAGDGARQPR
jgi:anti-anti-sigma factor